MGRTLTHAELIAFTHVRSDTRERARIRRLAWMPGTFVAITLGRSVFLTTDEPADGTSTLLAHELVHVEQWADRGVLGFVRWYVTDFGRQLWEQRDWMMAYRAIEAETQARNATTHWATTRR